MGPKIPRRRSTLLNAKKASFSEASKRKIISKTFAEKILQTILFRFALVNCQLTVGQNQQAIC